MCRYTGEDLVKGGSSAGGLVEVTDVLSLSDITRFLMRWNHIEAGLYKLNHPVDPSLESTWFQAFNP